MKVVKSTDTHTIYQKRNERYAVKDTNKRFVNGEEKAKILNEAGLITLQETKKKPEPEKETKEEPSMEEEKATEEDAGEE